MAFINVLLNISIFEGLQIPCYGVAAKPHLNNLASSYMQFPGMCSLWYGYLCCGSDTVHRETFFNMEMNNKVGLEIDGDKHTLHFFVNENQIPFCVSGVPSDVYFGLKSLVKLSAPSASAAIVCRTFGWK